MNFLISKLSSIIPAKSLNFTSSRGNYRLAFRDEKDVFIKSQKTAPTFTGQYRGDTSQGSNLKDLDNITCPYSGVKMISGRKMDKIEEEIRNSSTLQEQLDILRPYKNCMQKIEKQVFNMFDEYAKTHPDTTVNDCLNELKPNCLAELRIEEFKILDKVDKISYKLDANTALDVRKVTTRARTMIIADRQDQIFKRKDLLSQLNSITEGENNERIRDMWETANQLPKSTNNINAFVVKYANRNANEVCTRLLRPSVASIEHITPASKDGDNTLANFMLVSRDWNSDRGNIPLPEYIQKHPNIPKYTQQYTEDIIKAIKNGKLPDSNWYPYVLKEKLYNESRGLIDISLGNYDISEDDAMKTAPDNVKNIYDELKAKNLAKDFRTEEDLNK